LRLFEAGCSRICGARVSSPIIEYGVA
jgi:hypothetical protein